MDNAVLYSDSPSDCIPYMTYLALLEQLLTISIQKANDLIDVVRKEGQTDSTHFLPAKELWEAAEQQYVALYRLIESRQIVAGDIVSDTVLDSIFQQGGKA